jgi:putative nucleotidyltransferase with HDIG domain
MKPNSSHRAERLAKRGADDSASRALAARLRALFGRAGRGASRGGSRRRALDGRSAFILASCVAASFILLLAFGPGAVDSRGGPAALEEGRIADKDITADREISFVDEKATRLRIEAEERLVLPVFVVDEKPASRAVERFRDFQDLLGELSARKVAGDTLYLQVQSAFPGLLVKDEVLALARSPLRPQAMAFADAILKRLLDQGIAALPASGLEAYNPDYIELRSLSEGKPVAADIPVNRLVTLKTLAGAVDAEIADRRLARPLAALAASLVLSFAVEDAFFDQEQSSRKLAEVRAEVEPVVRTIAKGERIVRKGAIVGALDAAKLKAAKGAVSRVDWGATSGALGLLVASLCLGGFLLGKAVSGAAVRRSSIGLVAVSAFAYFALALLVGRFARPAPLGLAFLLPSALFAIVATILEGQRFAVLLGLVLAALAQAAFGIDGRLFAFCLLSSVAGAFSVRTASSRIDLVKAGAVLSLLEGALGAALAAPGATGAAEPLLAALWGAGNGFACALLALALLPVLEQALNAPTRFRLMELSDLNAPILKRLLTVAPGTYSHSVTVAHLAESACREIGADPLLARVGAYYHDIGKIEQPEYFIENQSGYNKHDELNPRLSATVIRSHVKLGAEKARALGLPEGVVEIVSQHHGNAVISWFFDQAKKAGGDIDPDDFTYPGQTPATKEAAVVMLADSVEAATRSLKKPTASRLEDFIREIIMAKVQDGQLDRCDLTFKDIETIRNSFTRILAGHFHSRIEYPRLKEQPR